MVKKQSLLSFLISGASSDEQIFKTCDPLSPALSDCTISMDIKRIDVWKSGGYHKIVKSITKTFSSYLQRRPILVANVMGCYSTQSELARHDSRAHVQQLTIFSTTPACFARHATRAVNITDSTLFQWNLDSGFHSLLGFRSTCLSSILDSKALDSGFHEQNFPGFWILQGKISQIIESRYPYMTQSTSQTFSYLFTHI